jgi:diadenosine tetraphosphatase ApaH/serine/threonine PP2A family protein phosphatase
VIGNHDWAVLGELSLDHFNTDARLANAWTQDRLSEESTAYLRTLPNLIEEGGFTLVHGSPREPIWEYVMDAERALANFDHFRTSFCLIGHTHIPAIFVQDTGRGRCRTLSPRQGERLPVVRDRARMILNPGSVGQPRDGDPRASYALLDTQAGTWEHRRVPYSIKTTQDRMRAYGLPRRLIQRLELGR